jgi:hypothetical protein
VIIWLPLVAFAPGHPSLPPPPLPVQFVALVDCHVMVIDWPAVNEVGVALTVTLTANAVKVVLAPPSPFGVEKGDKIY